MTTDEAIAALGIDGVKDLALTLQISVQAVYLWKGSVPKLREYEIREIAAQRAARSVAQPDTAEATA